VLCAAYEGSRFVRRVGNRLHCVATYLLNYLFTPWRRVLLEKLTGSRLVRKFYAFYGTRRFNYLFTPWRRVLLEKLTGSRLVRTFYAFYGTRRFITAITSARHLSLS
jgi:hypothetical protein